MGRKNGCTRVLIIEDNNDLATLLREQLQYFDCEVRAVTNMFDDLLQPEPWQNIDAVVLDMWLTPQGWSEGWPVAFKILQYLSDNFPGIVRVVYSAIPQPLLVHNGVKVQQLAHYVFTKPMRTDELVEALRG